jgi:hypothetical protein
MSGAAMKLGVVVTTKGRPEALTETMRQLVVAAKQVSADVLLVHDEEYSQLECIEYQWGSREREECVEHLWLPENRGLACALNIGLSYWLADPEVSAIAYFQDDVDVHPLALAALLQVLMRYPECVVTGNDPSHARADEGFDEHPLGIPAVCLHGMGIRAWHKASCRGTMMLATAASWARVMPIRSKGLGLPKRLPGQGENERGEGSGVDWWIVRDSPQHLSVICVPDLVRIRLWEAKDSTWNNKMRAGPDRPLSEQHIAEWIKTRSAK